MNLKSRKTCFAFCSFSWKFDLHSAETMKKKTVFTHVLKEGKAPLCSPMKHRLHMSNMQLTH